jgi:hypothetical protein
MRNEQVVGVSSMMLRIKSGRMIAGIPEMSEESPNSVGHDGS